MSDYAKIMVVHPANGGAKTEIYGRPKDIFACLSILIETISNELDVPVTFIFDRVHESIEKAAQSAVTDERHKH